MGLLQTVCCAWFMYLLSGGLSPGWSGCGPRCATAAWSPGPSSSGRRSRGSGAPCVPRRCWAPPSCWRWWAWPSPAASSRWSESCRWTSSRIPAALAGPSSEQRAHCEWAGCHTGSTGGALRAAVITPTGRNALYDGAGCWFNFMFKPPSGYSTLICLDEWRSHKPLEHPRLVSVLPSAWVGHGSSPGSRPEWRPAVAISNKKGYFSMTVIMKMKIYPILTVYSVDYSACRAFG